MLAPRRAEQLLSALVAADNFDVIADSLQALLGMAWEQAGESAIVALLEFLAQRDGPVTLAAIREATGIMDNIMGAQLGNRVAPVVREAVTLAYSLSQDQVRAGLSSSFNLPDRRAITWLHQHEMYWTRTHFTREWTGRISNLAEVAIKNGLSRHDAGLFFRDTLGGAFSGETDSYWSLVADAITTRSRSFGSVEAFVKAGVTRYEVDAVIDHRTSEICEYMDGKQFEVADAVAVRDAMIAAPTPEDAKLIMPWAKPVDVVDRPPADLAAMGVLAPPFHGNCRSRLVIV